MVSRGGRVRAALAPTGWLPHLAGAVSWLVAEALAERDRWFLWLPVAVGAGVLTYFALPEEPPPWSGAAIALGLGALYLVCRGGAVGILLAGLAAVALGMTAAQWSAVRAAAPVLDHPVGPLPVQGEVVEVSSRNDRLRVLLQAVSVPGLAADETPARVRVTLTKSARADLLVPGARLRVVAALSPPPAPAAPGSYDFARAAWFARIGAVGYAVSQPLVEPPVAQGTVEMRINRWRYAVNARILDALPGTAGAVAAALLIGDRTQIPAAVEQAMRDSGLAHLLSISGLHLSIVCGVVYGALRLGLALWPSLALRFPIKKWSAAGAILFAGFYLLLSGASVPTQRSFLMAALVLFAVIVDRSVLSMRGIAWAALAVLLVAPESVLGPSFQMSFAAVVALIATYEGHGRRLGAWLSGGGWARRALVYVGGVMMTTLVATVATSLFSIYHFNQIAMHGMLANLVAVPLASLWVMPLGALALALMPFGAAGPVLVAMGWGIDGIVATGTAIATWPGAVWHVPAIGGGAVLVAVAGGVWFCLWRRPWRRLGALVAVVSVLGGAAAERPDVLVDASGRLFAVRLADGVLTVSGRAPRMVRDTWLQREGVVDAAISWSAAGAAGDRLRCDRLGCIYLKDGLVVALASDPEAQQDDCQRAHVLINTGTAASRCRGLDAVIDGNALAASGGHAIYLDRGHVRVATVAEQTGRRPWSRRVVVGDGDESAQ